MHWRLIDAPPKMLADRPHPQRWRILDEVQNPVVGVSHSRTVAESLRKHLKIMVLQERIELSTSPLPRECSTTELLQLSTIRKIADFPRRIMRRMRRFAQDHIRWADCAGYADGRSDGRSAGYVAQAAAIGKTVDQATVFPSSAERPSSTLRAAPTRMIRTDTQIQVMKPMTAPSEP